jgi:nicotinate-nucleotide pyrophosphorylase (carboxylating)
MPPQIKSIIREALNIGGAKPRVTDKPFIYLDKNYVRIFGGISAALIAAQKANNRTKVIQLKGETKPIAQEAEEAALNGADIIMIDTGNPDDVDLVSKTLHQLGLRDKIKIAFAGNIKLGQIHYLQQKDIEYP